MFYVCIGSNIFENTLFGELMKWLGVDRANININAIFQDGDNMREPVPENLSFRGDR